jgi:hypothetical protein
MLVSGRQSRTRDPRTLPPVLSRPLPFSNAGRAGLVCARSRCLCRPPGPLACGVASVWPRFPSPPLSPHRRCRGERETRPKTGQKPGTGTEPQRPDQGGPARGGRRAGAPSARPSQPAGQAAEATRTQLWREAFGLHTEAPTFAHVGPTEAGPRLVIAPDFTDVPFSQWKPEVRIPSHSVHPFRSNPYTDSDVFVHPLRRLS